MGYIIGIAPPHIWELELWELNTCVKTYNDMQKNRGKELLTTAWQTAAFTGASFGGKLKKLDAYLKDKEKVVAPKVSKEEFEKRLVEAERRAKHVD